jgi:hypothetical protein
VIRRLIARLFGPCAAYGHQWIDIPPTPEEAAEDQGAYQSWFDNYPIEEYPTLHGHTECSVCGGIKPSNGSAGRPSGYHPGWG